MSHRRATLMVLVAAAATLSLTTAATSGAADTAAGRGAVQPHVVVAGLDNPRQLTRTPDGRLVLALAGRGGDTGKLAVIEDGRVRYVMRGFPSFADEDGSFAVGLHGAHKRPGPGGAYYGLSVPKSAPAGQRRDVWLLAKRPGGKTHKVADLGRFERFHDPDGEGVESNPYSVLALRHRVLVADAAGDYIAQVTRDGIGVWAVMPEYGPRIDAVPTVLTKGRDGYVYVGELHSERKGKAKVWQFGRDGERLRAWKHFTTVTGVDRTHDGTLFVSELFGGPCDFDRIPNCFPGRVVKVAPDGDRTYYRVPFPAGITARGKHVWVSAFSISPGAGFGGHPKWSGRVWHFTS